jgi:Spy/CpxP family protein refolding chaperone
MEDDYSSTSSNSIESPHRIDRDRRRAQRKDKELAMSSSETPRQNKSIVEQLYKAREKLNYATHE